ncbi:MAG TPA: hypothetical protein DCM40_46365, partial [Maribacter sp.]|nr:hypothetical protein [Maribacter sp.]
EEYSLEQRLEQEPFYNWPYDFLSFVEKVKIDAQILFKTESSLLEQYQEDDFNRQERATTATPFGPVSANTQLPITYGPASDSTTG